ncbi:sigma-70 family RNA polymerase sigma factor [Chitinophaga lutea]|uniref:Sigma-70 family RNA polymerase sigma factor n=1 Tax=Chitinophaga lutea TaxID=2488634 RepID=A0A3N4PZ75_9BACT|nr:sigma-70 family RNA polymerase sigma factor [Chitinophaga lutea]RPE08990.1 sigma-70 family RNA polymerase sigma factor [Chitinophaga lutea]
MHALNGNTPTDHQLVEQVLRGDTRAFAVIIQHTEGLVAQIIFGMVRHAEDRKDLVQDVYLKAFKYLPGFRFQSKLSTWMARIAYNTCVNYLDKKQLLPLPEGSEAELPEDETATAALSRKQLHDILQAGIARLPPLYQTLITLFHQQECSYEEIGQITGLPEGTVKNYLFRARKALRDNLLLQYKKDAL